MLKPFDYGKVVTTGENVLNNRQANKMRDLDMRIKQAEFERAQNPFQYGGMEQLPGMEGYYGQKGPQGKFENITQVKPYGSDGSNNASAKTEIFDDGSTLMVLPNREVKFIGADGVEVTDPTLRTEAIKKALSLRQQRKEEDAARKIETAGKEESVKLRSKRIRELLNQYGDQGRASAREQINIRQALKLASITDQGRAAQVKMSLARLFPGIDVSDENALQSSLTQLTMDQLAKFKGPTTDFEFGVAQSIPGSIGDPKSANVARLKLLDRLNWFSTREVDQFREWIKNKDNNPEDFRFNINEQVKMKNGRSYSLSDLLETAAHHHMSMEEVIQRLNQVK